MVFTRSTTVKFENEMEVVFPFDTNEGVDYYHYSFMVACETNRPDWLEYIHGLGIIDHNEYNKAFILAVSNGNLEIVKFFLNYVEIDTFILYCAYKNNQKEILDCIVQYVVDDFEEYGPEFIVTCNGFKNRLELNAKECEACKVDLQRGEEILCRVCSETITQEQEVVDLIDENHIDELQDTQKNQEGRILKLENENYYFKDELYLLKKEQKEQKEVMTYRKRQFVEMTYRNDYFQDELDVLQEEQEEQNKSLQYFKDQHEENVFQMFDLRNNLELLTQEKKKEDKQHNILFFSYFALIFYIYFVG